MFEFDIQSAACALVSRFMIAGEWQKNIKVIESSSSWSSGKDRSRLKLLWIYYLLVSFLLIFAARVSTFALLPPSNMLCMFSLTCSNNNKAWLIFRSMPISSMRASSNIKKLQNMPHVEHHNQSLPQTRFVAISLVFCGQNLRHGFEQFDFSSCCFSLSSLFFCPQYFLPPSTLFFRLFSNCQQWLSEENFMITWIFVLPSTIVSSYTSHLIHSTSDPQILIHVCYRK